VWLLTVSVSDHTVENGVLLIPVVHEDDFGVYVCSARNKLGFMEATTELIPGGLTMPVYLFIVFNNSNCYCKKNKKKKKKKKNNNYYILLLLLLLLL